MGAWGHAEGRRGHAGPPFATPRDRISPHPRSGRGFAGHGRQTPGQNDNEASGPPNPSLAVTGSRSTYVLAPDLGPVWAANRAPVRSGPVGRLMPSPPVTGSRPDLVLSTTRRRPIRSRAVRSRRLERPRRPVARPHGPVPASFGRAGRPEAPDEQSLDGRAVVPVAEVHGGHRGAPLTPRGKCEPAGEDHESNGQVGRRRTARAGSGLRPPCRSESRSEASAARARPKADSASECDSISSGSPCGGSNGPEGRWRPTRRGPIDIALLPVVLRPQGTPERSSRSEPATLRDFGSLYDHNQRNVGWGAD